MQELIELLRKAEQGAPLTYGEWQALEREGYAEREQLTRTGKRVLLEHRTGRGKR